MVINQVLVDSYLAEISQENCRWNLGRFNQRFPEVKIIQIKGNAIAIPPKISMIWIGAFEKIYFS